MPDEPDKPNSQFLERKLATILSADVAEFSRLMGEDEEQTLRTFRGHKEVFESLVAMHRGRIFNTAGDAILAEFNSAVEAVRCATDIQAALRTRNDQLPPSRQVRFRIGINLGDVMLQGQDLMGDGVNVAARLQTAAEPGGICISGSVHDQITNKLSLSFLSLGEMNFKNIQQPVRTFSITDAPVLVPTPVSPRPAKSLIKWSAAGLLLLLAGGGYWIYSGNKQSKLKAAPAGASEPETKPADSHHAANATSGASRYDGVYAGQICYGATRTEPERCYHAEGTVTGNEIAGQWNSGTQKKLSMHLAGNISKSHEVKIVIEVLSQADQSRVSTIELTGTLHGGLLNASGSFLKGRSATLNWRKTSATSH